MIPDTETVTDTLQGVAPFGPGTSDAREDTVEGGSVATVATAEGRPTADPTGRAERDQALLLAAHRHVNPETGRLPADQAKAVYADLAEEFGLGPSSVAAYLPA